MAGLIAFRPILLCLLLFSLLLPGLPVYAQDSAPLVLVLEADGPLTPAMREYLKRGIRMADEKQAEALVFQLDTPGGSVDLMTEMVEEIRASRVPVIVYIAPRGAMAGSAGTVITLAGHASGMAPETAIGAASPVGSEGEDLGQTMQAKVKNVMKATVRSLAERRSPEAVGLAEEMIDDASAVSAQEAVDIGLVDFLAVDVADLLSQADGFTVQLGEDEVTLHTAGALMQEVNPSFIEQLLSVLTNPAIVFILLAVGVQAVLIEISSPGGWVAGFIGVICLALAGYGMGVLPVNWFGIIFLVIAFVLFILDIYAPTHGALTVAGVASLIVAGMVLFNSPSVPSFQRVPAPIIVGASLATGAIFFSGMLFALRFQRVPVRMGMESLPGRTGLATGDLAPTGQVQIGGEKWTAELAAGEQPISAGERVQVVSTKGLRVIVRKAPDNG